MNETNGMVTISVPTRITDPATLELLGRQIVESIEHSISPAETQTEPRKTELKLSEKQSEPPKPEVRPWSRWDFRLRDYCIAQMRTPGRIVRWATYWIRLPWRLGGMIWVMTGPRVSEAEAYARDQVCKKNTYWDARNHRLVTCRYVQLSRNGEMYEHCGPCGCPSWLLSRLKLKNRRKRWKCPLRKHAGTYPEDRQREAVKAAGLNPDAIFVSRGCSTCPGASSV